MHYVDTHIYTTVIVYNNSSFPTETETVITLHNWKVHLPIYSVQAQLIQKDIIIKRSMEIVATYPTYGRSRFQVIVYKV